MISPIFARPTSQLYLSDSKYFLGAHGNVHLALKVSLCRAKYAWRNCGTVREGWTRRLLQNEWNLSPEVNFQVSNIEVRYL